MIHLGWWDFPLPAFLSFLPSSLAWALATLLIWWLIALVVRFLVFRLAKAITRRKGLEAQEVVIDVSRRPLVLMIVLLGVVDSLAAFQGEGAWVDTGRRWLVAAIMALVSYWLWRLVKEVVVHYGEKLAQRSETRLDDVLVPIVNQFAPIVIFVVGGAAILQYLGVRLDALLVAIGGAAFILAFALQDILSNVFSGLSLLVDTPFRYGDLVRLEDGTTCQVVKIGVRVTQLFDIDTHAVIYMPNSKLANERLINLMQPTPELISSVNLVVGRQLDVEKVRSLLNDVLDGHPDLVGDVPTKLKRIEAFEVLSPEKRQHGMKRLRAEMAVERRLLDTSGALRALAQEISESEAGGFSKAEWEMARQRFEPLAQQLGELPGAPKRLEAHRGTLEDFLDQAIDELPADSLSGLTWSWVRTWARDPDIVPGEDDLRLRQQWVIKILGLWRRVGEIRRRLDREEGLEQRLDDSLLRLSGWLAKDFKQPVPPWKLSVAVFKGFRDGGLSFDLYFFVDNIELEHFWRQSRVEQQVRREVARRLRQEGMDFASPRYEIDFLQGRAPGLARQSSD